MFENHGAHEIVQIRQQVVGAHFELGPGNRLNGFCLKKQVQERHNQGKRKQREEYGDKVEKHVERDGSPIWLYVRQDAGEAFRGMGHDLYKC